MTLYDILLTAKEVFNINVEEECSKGSSVEGDTSVIHHKLPTQLDTFRSREEVKV